MLTLALVLSAGLQWSNVSPRVDASTPGMGAPLPASWDIGKSASHALGTIVQRSGAVPVSELPPPAAPTNRWLRVVPFAPLAADGRTLLLYLGRLLLEGG